MVPKFHYSFNTNVLYQLLLKLEIGKGKRPPLVTKELPEQSTFGEKKLEAFFLSLVVVIFLT